MDARGCHNNKNGGCLKMGMCGHNSKIIPQFKKKRECAYEEITSSYYFTDQEETGQQQQRR